MLSLASANEGDAKAVDERLFQLLVLSQAILSFQLPFAIIPLVQFTSDRRRMGVFANPRWLKGLAWLCAIVVVGLNGVLIWMYMGEWAVGIAKAGWHPLWIYATVGPFAVGLAVFLGWVTLYRHYRVREAGPPPLTVPELPVVRYQRIGVAVEFTAADSAVLAQAAAVARVHHAPLLLIHVVEGLGADFYGPATDDQESRADRLRMGELVNHLLMEGLQADGVLGYGDPPGELVRLRGAPAGFPGAGHARSSLLRRPGAGPDRCARVAPFADPHSGGADRAALSIRTELHSFFVRAAHAAQRSKRLNVPLTPLRCVRGWDLTTNRVWLLRPLAAWRRPRSAAGDSPDQEINRAVQQQTDNEDTGHEQHHGSASRQVAVAELLPFRLGEVQRRAVGARRDCDAVLGVGFVHALISWFTRAAGD